PRAGSWGGSNGRRRRRPTTAMPASTSSSTLPCTGGASAPTPSGRSLAISCETTATTGWSSTPRPTTRPPSGPTPRSASARSGSCASTSAVPTAPGTTDSSWTSWPPSSWRGNRRGRFARTGDTFRAYAAESVTSSQRRPTGDTFRPYAAERVTGSSAAGGRGAGSEGEGAGGAGPVAQAGGDHEVVPGVLGEARVAAQGRGQGPSHPLHESRHLPHSPTEDDPFGGEGVHRVAQAGGQVGRLQVEGGVPPVVVERLGRARPSGGHGGAAGHPLQAIAVGEAGALEVVAGDPGHRHVAHLGVKDPVDEGPVDHHSH